MDRQPLPLAQTLTPHPFNNIFHASQSQGKELCQPHNHLLYRPRTDAYRRKLMANRRTLKRSVLAKVFKVFLTFFLVFAFVGYVRGRSVRQTPERIRIDLFKSHRDKFKLLGSDGSGGPRIIYGCSNHKYWYDLEKGKVYRESPGVLAPEAAPILVPAILSDGTIITAFAGGTASVWTVREIISYVTAPASKGAAKGASALTKSSKVRMVIAAVLGTIFGYEIGYQLALSDESGCDRPEYLKLLEEPAEWKPLKAAFWQQESERVEGARAPLSCGSKNEALNRTQEEAADRARVKFEQYKQDKNVQEVGHDFSPADFEAVYEFEAARIAFLQACGQSAR